MIDRSKILFSWKKKPVINQRIIYERSSTVDSEPYLTSIMGTIYQTTPIFLREDRSNLFDWYAKGKNGRICNSGHSPTLESALGSCDVALVNLGWVLLDKRTESLL